MTLYVDRLYARFQGGWLQVLDLQRDALQAAGIDSEHVYEDLASGKPRCAARLDRLKAWRKGDRLLVWKLDRLGRHLRHLINTVHDLTARGIGFPVLTGHGASINTATPEDKLVFGLFAALAEFERELVSERPRSAWRRHAGVRAAASTR